MSVPAPCSTCGYQHIPVGEYDHDFAPPTPVTNSKTNEQKFKCAECGFELGSGIAYHPYWHCVLAKDDHRLLREALKDTHHLDYLLQQTVLEARLDELEKLHRFDKGDTVSVQTVADRVADRIIALQDKMKGKA